jgi:hypothetical protein
MNISKSRILSLERTALYLAIVIFIAFHLLENLGIDLSKRIPEHSSSVFLGVTVLMAIHQILHSLESRSVLNTTAIKWYESFADAFAAFMHGEESISELCIVAYTSRGWWNQIRLQQKRLKKVRLLLLQSNAKTSSPYDTGIKLCDILPHWEAMANGDGRKIEKLEMKRILFDTCLYLGILNRRRLLIGFLWPVGSEGLDRFQPKESVVIYLEPDYSQPLVKHFTKWFDQMWAEAKAVDSRTADS